MPLTGMRGTWNWNTFTQRRKSGRNEEGGIPVPKNMYTVAGDGPCNEELALRIQAGDKNAAERLISQNEGYLTELAQAYTPWCETEDWKQEAALALLDAAGRFDPAYGTKLLTYATPVIEDVHSALKV